MQLFQFRRALRATMVALAFVAVAAAAPGAWSAPRRQAPLHLLGADPYTVVCAHFVTLDAPDRLQLNIESTLHGKARERIVIRIPGGLVEQLDPASSYVFAYVDLQRAPNKPGVYLQLEEGTLASTDGAEPAVFRDCAHSARWFEPQFAEQRRSATYRDTVLAGVRSADPQEQNLWIAELMLRPKLLGSLTESERTSVFALAAAPDTHPAARAMLLQAAVDGSLAVTEAELRSVVTGILMHTEVAQAPALANPEQAVFVALQEVSRKTWLMPAEAIERWLRSPRPALAEQAALTLRARDPDREVAAIEATLAISFLPAATRAFLRDHLRRLQLQHGK